jgi:hypothetical protein
VELVRRSLAAYQRIGSRALSQYLRPLTWDVLAAVRRTEPES